MISRYKFGKGVVSALPLFTIYLLALVFLVMGCTNITYVRLGPNEGTRMDFRTERFDYEDHAFFTAGPETKPDAVLAIDNKFTHEFDPKGWMEREKTEIPDLVKGLDDDSYKGTVYGMLVRDEAGIVKGRLYTKASRLTLFVYEDEGLFTIQTPNMNIPSPARCIFSPRTQIPEH